MSVIPDQLDKFANLERPVRIHQINGFAIEGYLEEYDDTGLVIRDMNGTSIIPMTSILCITKAKS
jgi:sRNA-binding regulator protein Hfq